MPIIHRIEQRSELWHKMRLGLPCSSEFHRIITPGGKVSAQAEDYAHRLLAELMLGRPIGDDIQTQYMVRGEATEDQAIESFEFQTSLETSPGGFITTNDGKLGCSPDRLIGLDGVLEIKVPAANTMIGYLLDPTSMEFAKRPQIMGQMLICERDYVDLAAYHPEMPMCIRRVRRDESYIGKLRTALTVFCEQLAGMQERIELAHGPFRPITFDKPAPPAEDGLGVSEDDVHAMWEASQ